MDLLLSNNSEYSEWNISTTDGPIGNVTNVTVMPPGGGGPVWYPPWNNPKNIISKEAADNITEVFECYIFPVLTVVGLAGNICSLIVLMQKKLRNSTTSVILIGLAVSDALFLVTNFVRESSCIVAKYDQLAADTVSATTFYYMHYLKTAFSRTSTVLVVLISVERVIAVAVPLKAKIWVTKPRMIAAVVFSYVLTFGSLAGYPPQYTYTYIGEKPFIAYTEFALDNAESLKVYNEYFLPIGFRHIPVIVVFILNTIIIVLLRRSKRFQATSTSHDPKRKEEQRKITRMLLTVAIVYLICLLPGDVFLRCAIEIPEFQFFNSYHNLFLALSDICLFFEMVNSCINFVIYMVLNRNFYNTYVQLFCCLNPVIRRLIGRESGTQSTMKTKDTCIRSKSEKSKESLSGVATASGQCSKESEGHANDAYQVVP